MILEGAVPTPRLEEFWDYNREQVTNRRARLDAAPFPQQINGVPHLRIPGEGNGRVFCICPMHLRDLCWNLLSSARFAEHDPSDCWWF